MVTKSCEFQKAQSTFHKSRFIDTQRLLVKGGAGGHGLPRIGGVGGDGGSVKVEGCPGTD